MSLMNVLYGYENDRGRLGVFSTAVSEWCFEPILSLDRYSHEYRSAYIVGRVIVEKDGDGCTGRDVVMYADEELFESSMREAVPERDDGYGTLVPVVMLEELISHGMSWLHMFSLLPLS
jgi:hypothetical protein